MMRRQANVFALLAFCVATTAQHVSVCSLGLLAAFCLCMLIQLESNPDLGIMFR